ncbi:MAG: hypothetical protein RLZZ546_114 [Bacteroidota bacterium]
MIFIGKYFLTIIVKFEKINSILYNNKYINNLKSNYKIL